jgi:hypothetical protein
MVELAGHPACSLMAINETKKTVKRCRAFWIKLFILFGICLTHCIIQKRHLYFTVNLTKRNWEYFVADFMDQVNVEVSRICLALNKPLENVSWP